jgi:3-isopropylmalate/(R)-2-methylmalate dehydratase small subunit
MARKFKGKVWVFGDNLDVDKEIIPFRERELGLMRDGNYGKWVMTPVDPDFPKKVKKGDIMVVGTNMGCGHGHYEGILGLNQCGISCVIAESVDRNFFKNSIDLGLPIIECEGIKQKVKEGDVLEVNLQDGEIKNLTTGKILKFTPLPDFLLEILESGGLEPYVTKQIAAGKV